MKNIYKKEVGSKWGNTKQYKEFKLKNYITKHYYKCTNEVLLGLSKLCVSDDRFKNNIDKYGENTAEYVSEVIGYFCVVTNS